MPTITCLLWVLVGLRVLHRGIRRYRCHCSVCCAQYISQSHHRLNRGFQSLTTLRYRLAGSHRRKYCIVYGKLSHSNYRKIQRTIRIQALAVNLAPMKQQILQCNNLSSVVHRYRPSTAEAFSQGIRLAHSLSPLRINLSLLYAKYIAIKALKCNPPAPLLPALEQAATLVRYWQSKSTYLTKI